MATGDLAVSFSAEAQPRRGERPRCQYGVYFPVRRVLISSCTVLESLTGQGPRAKEQHSHLPADREQEKLFCGQLRGNRAARERP